MGASGVDGGIALSWPPRAGLRVLVPGYPQWAWRQRERGAVFFGSYAAALAVGLFAWGSAPGWGFVAFALAVHAASAADAIRQGAFPGFGRLVPIASASAGVGLIYAPALLGAWTLAWPTSRVALREGFLVNRWAFIEAVPEAGQWIWYDGHEGGGRGVGRIRAVAGEEVEWIDGQVRIGGQLVDWRPPALREGVRHMILHVPEGHVLLECLPDEAGPGWIVVETGAIQGRAWAQHSPIWARRLLD
jgi:hypothetical protein